MALIVALATVAGLSAPALVASMRIEWQRLLGPRDSRLAQAYAFESSAQVALYIIGPLIAGAGVALVGAGPTLGATSLLGLAGGLAFAFQASDARPAPAAPHGTRRPIRLRGLRTLIITTALADAGLGAVDIAVVAFAQQHGQAGAAGLLLAVFAASSVLGGMVYGARTWTSAPHGRRMTLLTAAGAVALVPLALADSLVALGFLLAVAGAPFTAQWGGEIAGAG